MKIDLSDLKEGDKIFSTSEGYIKAATILDNVIHGNGCEAYYKSGKSFEEDLYPAIFHSIEECIEYFKSVKKEMDEANKPKKRYWLWTVYCHKNVQIEKTNVYLDDDGRNTVGNKLFDCWEEYTKNKHESEFIDV